MKLDCFVLLAVNFTVCLGQLILHDDADQYSYDRLYFPRHSSGERCNCTNTNRGMSFEWSNWGSCNPHSSIASMKMSCHKALRVRTRCNEETNCKEDDFEHCYHEESCRGEWTMWKPINECSRSCGGGHFISMRMCRMKGEVGTFCKGTQKTFETSMIKCNPQSCPSWGEWEITDLYNPINSTMVYARNCTYNGKLSTMCGGLTQMQTKEFGCGCPSGDTPVLFRDHDSDTQLPDADVISANSTTTLPYDVTPIGSQGIPAWTVGIIGGLLVFLIIIVILYHLARARKRLISAKTKPPLFPTTNFSPRDGDVFTEHSENSDHKKQSFDIRNIRQVFPSQLVFTSVKDKSKHIDDEASYISFDATLKKYGSSSYAEPHQQPRKFEVGEEHQYTSKSLNRQPDENSGEIDDTTGQPKMVVVHDRYGYTKVNKIHRQPTKSPVVTPCTKLKNIQAAKQQSSPAASQKEYFQYTGEMLKPTARKLQNSKNTSSPLIGYHDPTRYSDKIRVPKQKRMERDDHDYEDMF